MKNKLSDFEQLKKKARENPQIAKFLDEQSDNVEIVQYVENGNPIVEVKHKEKEK